MEIKKIYQKVCKGAENLASAGIVTLLLSPYIILASGVTAPFRNLAGAGVYAGGYLPVKAGIEYVQNKSKEEFVGKLKDVGLVYGLGTHSKIRFAEFELENGRVKKVYDFPRVLEGKLTANQVLPKQSQESNWADNLSFTSSESNFKGKNLSVGADYQVTSIDDVVVDVD